VIELDADRDDLYYPRVQRPSEQPCADGADLRRVLDEHHERLVKLEGQLEAWAAGRDEALARAEKAEASCRRWRMRAETADGDLLARAEKAEAELEQEKILHAAMRTDRDKWHGRTHDARDLAREYRDRFVSLRGDVEAFQNELIYGGQEAREASAEMGCLLARHPMPEEPEESVQ
jgi:hypothetical protein